MRSASGSQLPSKRLRGVVCALALCLLPPAAAFADEAEVDQQIDTLLGDHAVFKATIADLQERVANEDTIAFSAFVDYPITVTVNGERQTIRSAEEFEPLYHDIVTPEIADVIVSQDYGSLFVNGDGVMFGDGQVWMNGICLDDACGEMEARIVTIQAAD